MSKLFVFILCMVFFASVGASQISLITSLDALDFSKQDTLVYAPYSIISKLKYTSKLEVYLSLNYEMKIINNEHSNKILFNVSKLNFKNTIENVDNIDKPLPWWHKSVPHEVKNIDFSKIDGKSEKYSLGNGYKLTLLKQQGNWGKVYLLEHFSKKICAMKLIFTRADRTLALNEFKKRHLTEIKNNLKVSHLDIAIKPYGIIRNDDDHYLLFMEYGENGHDYFKGLSLNKKIEKVREFMAEVNKLHALGYAHGDLKIDNMLFVDHKVKLCDWLSLTELNKTIVGEYRYIGDNLPPEAIRANYVQDDKILHYSIIGAKENQKSYFLHPITADRFCFAVSLLEILEPDLYKKISYTPKDFNPWKPDSLDFYPQYVTLIKETQKELLEKSNKIKDRATSDLYKQLAQFIDIDPMKRIILDSDDSRVK